MVRLAELLDVHTVILKVGLLNKQYHQSIVSLRQHDPLWQVYFEREFAFENYPDHYKVQHENNYKYFQRSYLKLRYLAMLVSNIISETNRLLPF